jgi:hypothetical protein
MRILSVAALLIGVQLLPAGAGAADLAKIDRVIRKEPAYKSKPKYCLLVFGPEVKERVWLVLDGDTLYVDKNGNGDLTAADNRFQAPAFTPSRHPAHARERSITAGDLQIGGLTHTGLTVSQIEYRHKADISAGAGLNTEGEWQEYLDSIRRQVPDGVVYMVQINLDPTCYGLFGDAEAATILHFAWIDAGGQLAFADRPQDAPVVHFGGPLALRHSPGDKLRHGDPQDVTLCLGTAGSGPGSFATMSYDLVPKDVCPVIEVQFPAKKTGLPGITRKYVLKERC